MEEKIVACAFKDAADGKVYLSRTCHAEIIGMFFGIQDKEIGHRCEQGFITNLDRFVDRKEALVIAKKNNENLNKLCKSDELYSEDLFLQEHELINKNKELEKMIELMADRLTHYRISDDGVNTRLATREEKIEWFRKKAKGE